MVVLARADADTMMLEAALGYARRGWRVHPLRPGDKRPMLTDWPNQASCEEGVIVRWWTQTPTANIGVAAGPSGLTIIDVDVKGDADGMESWHDLAAEIGQCGTVTCETPSGGMHLYYLCNGHQVRNSAGTLGPGLDVRANGGYVVCPPSRLPNGEYCWALGLGPGDTTIADLPSALAARLASTPSEAADVLPSAGIAPGARNDTLASMAGTMRRRGMCQEAIAAALLAENEANCNPPLPEEEVRAIAASVAKYTPASSRPHVASWTVDGLLAAELPEPTWVVPGLLPAGLALLAGRPKQGKSLLALQLGIALGSGGAFLGRPLPQADAVMIALEDNPRRLQARLRAMGAPAGCTVSIRFGWPSLSSDEGRWDLERLLDDGARLIVIDTLARAVQGRTDWDSTGWVTEVLGPLQQATLEHEACLLCVDHHRKPGISGENLVDDISGSTGKSAVADTILGLYRKRGQKGATLRVTGRDVDEAEVAIELDGERLLWALADAALPGVQQDVVDAIQELGSATVTELATFLGKARSNISVELGELANKGLIKRRGSGRTAPYILAN